MSTPLPSKREVLAGAAALLADSLPVRASAQQAADRLADLTPERRERLRAIAAQAQQNSGTGEGAA